MGLIGILAPFKPACVPNKPTSSLIHKM